MWLICGSYCCHKEQGQNTYEQEINVALQTSMEWLEVSNLKVDFDKTKFIQYHIYRSKLVDLNYKVPFIC